MKKKSPKERWDEIVEEMKTAWGALDRAYDKMIMSKMDNDKKG